MNNKKLRDILDKDDFRKEDLIYLLSLCNDQDRFKIFEKAKQIKEEYVGNKVYLRGLIEYSNRCVKDCNYCGIRLHNKKVVRYTLEDEDVLKCAEYAYKNNYASIVIQSGELTGKEFTDKISSLLRKINKRTNHSLKITLSCGEQSFDTYKEWIEAGAHRYLLRIESSNPEIYKAIHPNNNSHSFSKRIASLIHLKEAGYQVGTGIMIGLPGQSIEDLAKDLLFIQNSDVDMVGMGPYVEHIDTPMYNFKDQLLSQEERYNLSMIMFALLRIMMKDINIASTTALDALNPNGRIEALEIASNVIMPNLTPIKYTENYHLYNNKPDSLHSDALVDHIQYAAQLSGNKIAFGEHGDSMHFTKFHRDNTKK
jgi:biotin synthase